MSDRNTLCTSDFSTVGDDSHVTGTNFLMHALFRSILLVALPTPIAGNILAVIAVFTLALALVLVIVLPSFSVGTTVLTAAVFSFSTAIGLRIVFVCTVVFIAIFVVERYESFALVKLIK